MSRIRFACLVFAGSALLVGALLHIAIIFGGPAWYRFMGAPRQLAVMAQQGSWQPAISCSVIAFLLSMCAMYAFSAAGVIRQLPWCRAVLALISVALIARAVLFIPAVVWQPHLIATVCGRCDDINAFVVTTSALCLVLGLACTAGVVREKIVR